MKRSAKLNQLLKESRPRQIYVANLSQKLRRIRVELYELCDKIDSALERFEQRSESVGEP